MSEHSLLDTLECRSLDCGYCVSVCSRGNLFNPVEHFLLYFEENAATVVLEGDTISSNLALHPGHGCNSRGYEVAKVLANSLVCSKVDMDKDGEPHQLVHRFLRVQG